MNLPAANEEFFESPIYRRKFHTEKLQGMALMAYHVLLARQFTHVWCSINNWDSFEYAVAEEKQFIAQDLALDLVPRGLGEINQLSWHQEWARGALNAFAGFVEGQLYDQYFDMDFSESGGCFCVNLISNVIEAYRVMPSRKADSNTEVEPPPLLDSVDEQVFYQFGIGYEDDDEEEWPFDYSDHFDSEGEEFGVYGSADFENWQWKGGRISLDNLSERAALARDVLLANGFVEVACQFNEASDEPHGYFDSAMREGVRLSRSEVVSLLESGPLGEASEEDSILYMYVLSSRSSRVRQSLDNLAEASSLLVLQEELRLPGHFYVNLHSGQWRPAPPSEEPNEEIAYELGYGDVYENKFSHEWTRREPVSTAFEPERLPEEIARTHRVLLQQGVTLVRCSYSFGEDEDFANIEMANVLSAQVDSFTLCCLMAGPLLQASLREEAEYDGAEQSRKQVLSIRSELDRFAAELRFQLFKLDADGENWHDYGQGHFYVNLQTQELVELPNSFPF